MKLSQEYQSFISIVFSPTALINLCMHACILIILSLFYANNLIIGGTYSATCFSNLFISLMILLRFFNLFPEVFNFLSHNILALSFYLWPDIGLEFLLRCSVSMSICEKSFLRHISLRFVSVCVFVL